MPPTTASDRLGAGSSAALRTPAAREGLASPGGTLAVAVGLVITIVIVLRATSAFRDTGGPASPADGYEEVDLGQVTRQLMPEAGGLTREAFMLRVVVVLNPKVRDLAALKLQVERRRNLFRDIVWSDVIGTKSDADLRKPAALEALKKEIRQRLNLELGGAKDGQEAIAHVIFPERRLPERR